jgi:hypothetical protein
MRPLAAHGQAPAMTQPAISAHLDKALDVHGDFFAEISFDGPFILEDLADFVDLILGQVRDLLVGIDPGAVAQRLGASASDSLNVGKTDLGPFLDR